jgi:hypothetical protein
LKSTSKSGLLRRAFAKYGKYRKPCTEYIWVTLCLHGQRTRLYLLPWCATIIIIICQLYVGI